jgi:hypothetical protein
MTARDVIQMIARNIVAGVTPCGVAAVNALAV